MKSGRRKLGNVFAFAAIFATLAFVSVGVASADTTVSQPKIDLFVQKAEFLFTHDTNIDHSQNFDFEVEWGAGVWNPQNLNNVTYTIRTTKDFRYTNNYELYLNGTEICPILPCTHIGDNYTWEIPLEDHYCSCIEFTLGNETVVQDRPWADLMVDKEKEGNYTRVSITFTPRSDIDANLIISGRNISVSAYPPEFEIEESFLYYINFYCEADNLIQNKSYNFSVVVEGLNRVEGWFERPYGWSESLFKIISLPVSGLGSITVQYDVPVKWSYNPSVPKYTQSIQIRRNQPPIASFTYHPENPIVNQTITFNASNSTDSDGNVTNYEWCFGDGNTETEKITTHSYSLAGDYIVNLTVRDNDNATNTTSKVVKVYPEVTTTTKITFSKPMYESSITHKSLNFVPHIASNNTTSVPIIDLLDAIDQNMVAASFIGWKSNSVIINITNYADHGLEIKVPKGLILNSFDGSKSNMAAGEIFGMITTSPLPNGWFVFIFYSPTSRIILDIYESKNYFISAYGVEFNKPTPGYKKEFSIGSINYDIQKILETTDAFHSWDKSTDAIQSAIWCYTDDISKEELMSKRENVRDKEILDAKTMLNLAGFETTSKKLFSEEISIPTANMQERLEDDNVMVYVNKKSESSRIGYKKAKGGYRWVILDVIIKNKMDEPLDFDVHDIKLRNNDNRIDVYDYSSYGTNRLDYAFKSTSAPPLPSKDTYRGEVAFEVPNNVSNLKMIFDIERFYVEIMLVDSQNPDTVPVSDFTPAYKIGEKAKDENIVVTVNSKRETEVIKDRKAEENRTFLILNITIENTGTDNLSYSPYSFAVQDENGYLFEEHYTTTYLENAFESGHLQPGQEYQGEISFEISKSSENIEMWYSPYSGPYIYVEL